MDFVPVEQAPDKASIGLSEHSRQLRNESADVVAGELPGGPVHNVGGRYLNCIFVGNSTQSRHMSAIAQDHPDVGEVLPECEQGWMRSFEHPVIIDPITTSLAISPIVNFEAQVEGFDLRSRNEKGYSEGVQEHHAIY